MLFIHALETNKWIANNCIYYFNLIFFFKDRKNKETEKTIAYKNINKNSNNSLNLLLC